MDDSERIIQLCRQSSFQGNDLIDMRNLYVKYINNKFSVCLHCPGPLRHMVTVFQQHEDIMLYKLKDEK